MNNALPTITSGQRLDQYNGKTKIRRVKVIETHGENVIVEALNGPMRGSRYEVAASCLRG